MRRLAILGLLMAAILMLAAPSQADGRGWRGGHGWHGWHGWHRGHGWSGWYRGGPRVVVGVAPPFWWGPGPWYYPSRRYYMIPPPVVQAPPVYVQPAPQPQSYWYFCRSARGYYPAVPSCPEPWLPVPPRAN